MLSVRGPENIAGNSVRISILIEVKHSEISMYNHLMAAVDILIPTYNPKPEHLTEALKSLQNQTFRNFRAFIRDDCSPNGRTFSIVEPFLSDVRIQYEDGKHRLGIGGNWNACVKATSSP